MNHGCGDGCSRGRQRSITQHASSKLRKTVLVLPGGSSIYTPDGKQILYVEVPDGKRTNGKHIMLVMR